MDRGLVAIQNKTVPLTPDTRLLLSCQQSVASPSTDKELQSILLLDRLSLLGTVFPLAASRRSIPSFHRRVSKHSASTAYYILRTAQHSTAQHGQSDSCYSMPCSRWTPVPLFPQP